MPFAVETLGSWDELSKYAAPGGLYRGQRRSSWALQTSLERCCGQRAVPLIDRRKLEERLCREFRRAYHQYGLHVPRQVAELEWLALMQHHGAPTRLLDFTYSIYVAAYFALEHAKADAKPDAEPEKCSVWRIKGPWALRASIAALENAGKPRASCLGVPYDEGDDEVFYELIVKAPNVLCTCPQTPFRLNERLRIQMGAFLVPGRIDASFEDNLSALPDHENPESVLKLEIPSRMREKALRQLFDMGVSRRSLFPGLDGYAQSLGVYSPAFTPIPWK